MPWSVKFFQDSGKYFRKVKAVGALASRLLKELSAFQSVPFQVVLVHDGPSFTHSPTH